MSRGKALGADDARTKSRRFGERLSAARRNAALTEHELARRAGMAPEAVAAIEAGDPDTTPDEMARLAATLGLDLAGMLRR